MLSNNISNRCNDRAYFAKVNQLWAEKYGGLFDASLCHFIYNFSNH